MENTILKVAGIKGTREFFEKMHTSKKIFIFKYRRIYQLHFSPNIKGGFYAQEFEYLRTNKGETPHTRRGKFYAFNASEANQVLNRDVFVQF